MSLAPGSRLATVYRFAALQVGLQPHQESRPAAVGACQFGMGGKAAMANTDQSSLLRRFQLPTNLGFHVARPARDPRMDEQAWRIDFQIFANRFECAPIGTYACVAPFPAGAQVALEFRAAINAGLPPPLQHLAEIDQRLEDALRRHGDLNLVDNSDKGKCRVYVEAPAKWKPAVQQQVSTNQESTYRGTLQSRVILAMVVFVILILIPIAILVSVMILVPVVVLVPAVIVFESAMISVPVTRIKLLSIMVRFDPSSTFIGRPRPVAFMPLVVMTDRIPITAYPHELRAWA